MFDRIELICGNTVIETLYPEFMNIYYNVFNKFTNKGGITRNTGPLYHNTVMLTPVFQTDNADSIEYNTNRNFVLHLPFYFSFRDYQCFPLCSLYKQELTVRVKMRDN